MNHRVGHIAVVGMGRSGSTYLDGALARELGGVAVGELPGMWTAWGMSGRFCSCGALAWECPFWRTVVEHYPGLRDVQTADFMRRMNERTLPIRYVLRWPLLANRARRGTGNEAAYVQEMKRLYAALAGAAATHGYNVLVDSSKHPYWYHVASRLGALTPFAPRTAVRLVRHPRPVAYSLRRPRVETTADGQRDLQVPYNLARAIPYWLAMNFGGDLVTRKGGAIRVRYEDLGGQPVYLDQLVSAGYVRVMPTAIERTGTWSHQVHGNPSRQGAAAHEFRRDTRWRDEPITRWESLVWKAVSPLLRRYGYRAKPPK